jgi:hypothetical protein
MLSAQGGSFELQSGYRVSQTIGQQSSVGNKDDQNFSIIQGFQQSAWVQLIQSSILPELQSISVYPNPFLTSVNFQFKNAIEGEVQISVFSLSGQLVANKKTNVTDELITIELHSLPNGIYLVHLLGRHLNYYTKVIKN